MTDHEKDRLLYIAERLAQARNSSNPERQTDGVLQQLGPDASAILEQAVNHLTTEVYRPTAGIIPLFIGVSVAMTVAYPLFGEGPSYLRMPFMWIVSGAVWGTLQSFVSRLGWHKKQNVVNQRDAVLFALSRRDQTAALRSLIPLWTSGAVRIAPLEAELSRLLQAHVLRPHALLPLDEEAMTFFRRNLAAFFPRYHYYLPPRNDFSDTHTDILISLIQLLERSGNGADTILLTRIANYPATLPNRVLVRDAARVFVHSPSVSSTGFITTGSTVAPAPSAITPQSPQSSPSQVVVGQRGPNP